MSKKNKKIWLKIATVIMNGLFLAFTTVSGSPRSEKAVQVSILTWNPYESLDSCERICSWINFVSVNFVVDTERCKNVFFIA